MPQFEKGHPGGPGRPRGSRNKATLWLEQKMFEAKESAWTVVDTKIKDDSLPASKVVLNFFKPRGSVIELDLPEIKCAADIAAAHGFIWHRVGAGEITTAEAHELIGLLEAHRRALETGELEARLEAVEEKQAKAGKLRQVLAGLTGR